MSHGPFLAAGWLLLVGLYGVVSSRHVVHLIVCLTVMQSSTYVLLASLGWVSGGIPPVFLGAPARVPAADPVLQALMLTDIVVEATMVALLLALAVQLDTNAGCADPDELAELKG